MTGSDTPQVFKESSKAIRVNVSDIFVPEWDEVRGDEEALQTLADSILELGQLMPIIINTDGSIVAGRRRLAAHKLLGKKKILAIVRDCTPEEAELIEIDENFARQELTILERAQQMARRRELYEGSTKGSGERVAGFAEQTSQSMGVSKRSVQQLAQIGRHLDPEVAKMLKGHPVEKSTTKLLELSRLSPEEQREAAELLLGESETPTIDPGTILSEDEEEALAEEVLTPADEVDELIEESLEADSAMESMEQSDDLPEPDTQETEDGNSASWLDDESEDVFVDDSVFEDIQENPFEGSEDESGLWLEAVEPEVEPSEDEQIQDAEVVLEAEVVEEPEVPVTAPPALEEAAASDQADSKDEESELPEATLDGVTETEEEPREVPVQEVYGTASVVIASPFWPAIGENTLNGVTEYLAKDVALYAVVPSAEMGRVADLLKPFGFQLHEVLGAWSPSETSQVDDSVEFITPSGLLVLFTRGEGVPVEGPFDFKIMAGFGKAFSPSAIAHSLLHTLAVVHPGVQVADLLELMGESE